MFAPKHYQADEETLRDIIAANTFGTMVTCTSNLDEVKCVRAPFLIDGNQLLLHVNIENNIWRDIQEFPDGAPVVCTFDGPHHYISPLWYKSEQDKSGSKVPTWNHASVFVKGLAKIVTDTEQKVELLKGLSHFNEAQTHPGNEWTLQYMPKEKLLRMVDVIAVIEIEITKIDGTLKMGQAGGNADCESTVHALTQIGTDEALGTAYLMRNSKSERPARGLLHEMENVAKERKKVAGISANLSKRTVVGAVLVAAVPVLAYFFLRSKN